MKRQRGKATPQTGVRGPAPAADPLQPFRLGGLAALLVATPILPSESTPLGCGAMALVLCWLLLVLAWFAAAAVRGPTDWRAGPTLALVVLLLGWYAVSTLVMAWTGQPRAAINSLWQWVGFGCVFFLTRQLIRTPQHQRAIVVLMLGLAAGLSVVGYVQYFHDHPAARARYERDPEGALREAGIVAPPGSPQRVHFENRLASKEPFATFALANSLAGFLSPWLIVALGNLIFTERTSVRPARTRWVAALTSLCLAGCWLLTKSRSAVLATVMGGVLLMIYGRRSGWRPDWRWIVGFAASGILLPVGALVVGGLDTFVLLEASKSLLYRVQYWRASAALIADVPLFGCGPGNFQLYYNAYKLPEASETVAEPHNFVFEIWATAGTPAIVLFITLLGGVVWQTWRDSRRSAILNLKDSESEDAPAGTRALYFGGLAGGLGGYLACAVLEGYLPSSSWLVLGLPAAAAVIIFWQDWVTSGRWPAAVPAIAAGVLLVNLAAAGGIGFAGVAQTLWLLLALLLGASGSESTARGLSRRSAGWLAVVVLGVVAVFAKTSYLPQLAARPHLLDGDAHLAAGRHLAAWESYRRAAEADPFAAEGWERIAGVAHQAWISTADPRYEQAYREATGQVARLNPRSSAWQMQLGRWALTAYRRLGQDKQLHEAIESFRVAIQFYPNYNLGHAQLAWTLHLAGDPEAAREASEALRLDRLNPHREQKLAAQRIADEGPPADGQKPPPGDQNAEQLMQYLRKNQNLDNP